MKLLFNTRKMMLKSFLTLSFLVFFTQNTSAQTVVDIIVNSPDHTILEQAIIAAGLDDDLSAPGPFTVFAPTDDAFNALEASSPGILEDLIANPAELAEILKIHVAPVEAFASSLTDGQAIQTLVPFRKLLVDIDGATVMISNGTVTTADIDATNGVVHVVDQVLAPASLTVADIISESEDHNTLEAALAAAELDDDLAGEGPFTVFAPTDDAFDALPDGTVEALLADPSGDLTNILLYHVIADEAYSEDLSNGQRLVTLSNGKTVKVRFASESVFINNAEVTVTDLVADNGVVHVIDAVLIPQTIVDIVVNSPVHETLEDAVIAAGLADDLSADGPFTLFAPTDAAFSALPAGTLETLLQNPEGTLKDILLYHAASGDVLSNELTDAQTITTLLGETVTVTINENGVFINDAKVIVTDLVATNGIVHVIDAVLIPELPTSIFSSAKNNGDKLKVYPNPAKGSFSVEALNSLNVENVSIYSGSGQLLISMPASTSYPVSLQSGLYTLHVQTDKGVLVEKLVID